MKQRVSDAVSRYGVQAALVAVAAIWGATFVVVADAIADYPVFGFLFWRFLVACIAFVLLFPRVLRQLTAANLRRGVLAGLVLTAGYVFQTYGLAPGFGTSPARAAFITGLYVIVTPLLQAVLLRHRPALATIVGALTAFAGLWVLSGAGVGGTWVLGDTLVVICALAYSVHFIVLGSAGPQHDTAALTLVQLLTVTVVTGALSLAVERPAPPSTASLWLAILGTGVLASAVAFAIQTYAQRRIPPARTALILVTEPAFGGLFGWLAAGFFPLQEVVGAALMLLGMVVSEVVAVRAAPAEGIAFEPAVEGMPAPVIEERTDASDEVDRP